MNPFQVQAREKMASFFSTITSSDTSTHILSFLNTGLSVCTISPLAHFLSGYYQKDSLQAFFRAPQDLWWSSEMNFPL